MLYLAKSKIGPFQRLPFRLPSQPIRPRSPIDLLVTHSIRSKSSSTYGKSPIALTFHTPSANNPNCINTYTAFTPSNFACVPSVSNLANTVFVLINPWIGPLNSINTIIILKICRLFPDMYIMTAFMGSCFEGARAISQAFLTLRASVSTGLEGVGCCCCCFCVC